MPKYLETIKYKSHDSLARVSCTELTASVTLLDAKISKQAKLQWEIKEGKIINITILNNILTNRRRSWILHRCSPSFKDGWRGNGHSVGGVNPLKVSW